MGKAAGGEATLVTTRNRGEGQRLLEKNWGEVETDERCFTTRWKQGRGSTVPQKGGCPNDREWRNRALIWEPRRKREGYDNHFFKEYRRDRRMEVQGEHQTRRAARNVAVER